MSLDLNAVFKAPFQDEKWVSKVLIGGVFEILILPIFLPLGYGIKIMKSAIEGEMAPLPDWDEWGDLSVKGLLCILISLIYFLIPGGILGASVVPFVLAILKGEHGGGGGGIAALMGGSLLLFLLGLFLCIVAGFLLPMALLLFAETGNWLSALSLGAVISRIKDCIGDYAIAFLVNIAAGMAIGTVVGILGMVMIGYLIGPFLQFYQTILMSQLFGQVYRNLRSKTSLATEA
ncbi:MAG: DUF4013 domain-containing protein [Armatimonadetes bacterium]|nr:DUF4013 domain-containing protein [Armatimonadota bacterium]